MDGMDWEGILGITVKLKGTTKQRLISSTPFALEMWHSGDFVKA